MRVHWMLRSGESIEIYDGDGPAKDRVVIYRVGVDRLVQAELKVVRPNAKAKIISRESRYSVVDVATAGALFLEATGKDGCAAGWYEAVADLGR